MSERKQFSRAFFAAHGRIGGRMSKRTLTREQSLAMIQKRIEKLAQKRR